MTQTCAICVLNLSGFQYSWIPWKLSFRYILFHEKKAANDAVTPQYQSQFTPKMKANAVPRLLSSLVWIDFDIVVSQHRLESFFMKLNASEWQVSWNSCQVVLCAETWPDIDNLEERRRCQGNRQQWGPATVVLAFSCLPLCGSRMCFLQWRIVLSVSAWHSL